MRQPNLLGLDKSVIPGLKDYYETTMADINMVAGISGRRSIFNAAVRGLRNHKVVGEDSFVSDGYTCVIDGKIRRFDTYQPDLKGKTYDLYETQQDNYLLNAGLEQILGYILNYEMSDELIKAYSYRGLSHELINWLDKNRKLDLNIEAIPEGIPIFGYEPVVSVEGSFEKIQFPETLILGTWGYQTAVATTASYIVNICEEFGKNIVLLEGGSRRAYPGCALAASRAALIGGFNGTSLEAIMTAYPELLYRAGGSSGHSEVLHIGNDKEAFELQFRAYYRIGNDDSDAVVREKIQKLKGKMPTFLIDTFDSKDGLSAAIEVMKKYGVMCQVRNDSGDEIERTKYIRMTADGEKMGEVKIMISNDLKPWKIHRMLKNHAVPDSLLIGTYLVNPYKLPGAAYKLAADQRDITDKVMISMCKVSANQPSKGTLPGPVDVYRIIGKDGKADRDVILMRGIDSIDDFITKYDSGHIKLNQTVMVNGELTYNLPDMCQIIELSKYHRDLLRPEHKRFINAVPYPVIISDTVKRIREEFAAKMAVGKLF